MRVGQSLIFCGSLRLLTRLNAASQMTLRFKIFTDVSKAFRTDAFCLRFRQNTGRCLEWKKNCLIYHTVYPSPNESTEQNVRMFAQARAFISHRSGQREHKTSNDCCSFFHFVITHSFCSFCLKPIVWVFTCDTCFCARTNTLRLARSLILPSAFKLSKDTTNKLLK